ncbi:hypothetical protein [Candidatus Oleimmundimicrobium sp.]|uniref:phage major capsid protein n=1 Tax=Candidatus Oleimmundimicrobium sp. TaxID=3060597 RepID=UPI002721CCF4|nr:hypothetical protein [Candidatus Oleimmundimicrobium sp.]MDO8885726.1 hypothetical protein [Candidatus Oleimmundimicrobium sp.]
MANETTYTTADDTRYAAVINEAVIQELRAAVVMSKLCVQKSLAGKPSKAIDFAKWPTIAAAAIAEGTDGANTAVSTSKATVTTGEALVMVTPTDVLESSDILDGLGEYSALLGRAMADKMDSDMCALLAGFTTVVGTDGSDMTETNFLDAIYSLSAAKAPKPYSCVLHPVQINDFRKALSTATGVIHTGLTTESLGVSNLNGLWGELYNVAIWESANVPLNASSASRTGGMFSQGYALALATKWATRVEPQRDASLRATELVCTAMYGVGELVDAAGVTILTDA